MILITSGAKIVVQPESPQYYKEQIAEELRVGVKENGTKVILNKCSSKDKFQRFRIA